MEEGDFAFIYDALICFCGCVVAEMLLQNNCIFALYAGLRITFNNKIERNIIKLLLHLQRA